MENWRERLVEVAKQWGVVAGVGVMGISLVGYGLWSAVKPSESFGWAQDKATVEIVREQDVSSIGHDEEGEIMVDVGGAVEKPGVYSLPKGSRIGEAISMAGGLAEAADRNWVSRYVNLASEVEDGAKVYIPTASENPKSEILNPKQITNTNDSMIQTGEKININTASVSELDTLWGIGEARANAIIAERPYSSIEELTSKANIPSNVFEKIKEQIAVY